MTKTTQTTQQPVEVPVRAGAERAPGHEGDVQGKGRGGLGLFFLTGHPRSGTNWLGNVLNLHPKVDCQGEFGFNLLWEAFERFVAPHWHVAHGGAARTVAEVKFRELVRGTVLAAGREGRFKDRLDEAIDGGWLVGDRTPRPLEVLLPGVPHVVIFRDGRDVAVSWTIHLLRAGNPGLVVPAFRKLLRQEAARFKENPEDFKAQARRMLDDERWARYMASGWAVQMQHDFGVIRENREAGSGEGGGNGGGTPICVVQYERLHADTEGERRRVYAFLGLDPDEAEPLTRRSKTVAGLGDEDPKRFFRKGAVGDWREYFGRKTCEWFDMDAGEILRYLGYENDRGWAAEAQLSDEGVG